MYTASMDRPNILLMQQIEHAYHRMDNFISSEAYITHTILFDDMCAMQEPGMRERKFVAEKLLVLKMHCYASSFANYATRLEKVRVVRHWSSAFNMHG